MNVNFEAKKGRKYGDVLRGARVVFLRDGFEGASVDDIAREAGVSKATLYSYFSDKRLMFLEVARVEIATITDTAMEVIDRTAPPQQVLTEAARTVIAFNCSRMGLGIYRMCIAEAERFPELAEAFYAAGPAAARTNMADYLLEAAERDELVIEDANIAADQFLDLCRSDIQIRLLLHPGETPTDEEKERVAQEAVTTFLARYGAKP